MLPSYWIGLWQYETIWLSVSFNYSYLRYILRVCRVNKISHDCTFVSDTTCINNTITEYHFRWLERIFRRPALQELTHISLLAKPECISIGLCMRWLIKSFEIKIHPSSIHHFFYNIECGVKSEVDQSFEKDTGKI